jgi:predicted membrane metal-binding protein
MIVYSLYILIGLLGLVLLLTSYRFFRLSRAQASQITSLQQQLSALCSAAVGSDERIVRFEQALMKMREQQNTMDLSQPQQQSYEHAIRLARKGVDINQLIDNCNLSEEEALLITRLHGTQRHSVTDLH